MLGRTTVHPKDVVHTKNVWVRLEERLNTLRSREAADNNTNERSQVENVSTVVLIDLTDTSSVSQWRELVAWPSAQRKCVGHSSLSLGSLRSEDPSLFLIPFLCFSPSHSLNSASPFLSAACPFICHSVQPHFHF